MKGGDSTIECWAKFIQPDAARAVNYWLTHGTERVSFSSFIIEISINIISLISQ